MKALLLILPLIGALTAGAQHPFNGDDFLKLFPDSAIGVGDSIRLHSWPSFKKIEYLFAKDGSKISAYRATHYQDTAYYLISIDYAKLRSSDDSLWQLVMMFDDGTWIDGNKVHLRGNTDDPGMMAERLPLMVREWVVDPNILQDIDTGRNGGHITLSGYWIKTPAFRQ